MSDEQKALIEELNRQKCAVLAENARLKDLLRKARNLHELPWKERVSLQDFIDEAVGA